MLLAGILLDCLNFVITNIYKEVEVVAEGETGAATSRPAKRERDDIIIRYDSSLHAQGWERTKLTPKKKKNAQVVNLKPRNKRLCVHILPGYQRTCCSPLPPHPSTPLPLTLTIWLNCSVWSWYILSQYKVESEWANQTVFFFYHAVIIMVVLSPEM